MLMKFVEDRYHEEGWRAISRMWGNFVGESYWKLVRKKFGSPVPVDRIIWYQDIAHMFFGPDTHAYSWCDEAKAVCARQRCLFRPMLGMQSCAKFCRVFDDAIVEAYMEIEPDLICMRTPDLGDDGTGERCVHMWTYEKEVVEKLDDKYKVLIPDSTKKVLEKKGVCL